MSTNQELKNHIFDTYLTYDDYELGCDDNLDCFLDSAIHYIREGYSRNGYDKFMTLKEFITTWDAEMVIMDLILEQYEWV